MSASALPPSPSWRSVLHPNRHIGRSVQYHREGIGSDRSLRGGSSDRREAPTRTSSSERAAGRWSLIAPAKQSQDDSHLYLSPFSRREQHQYSDALSSSPPSPSRSIHRQPPPFLTIALLKLTDVIPTYCQLLATGPSYKNAARACAILDGVVATASPSQSPVSGQGVSPHRPRHSQPSLSFKPYSLQQQQRPPSPLSFQYWMSKQQQPSSTYSPAASALALEGEWGTLVAPFLLLAAAEAMAADLEHLSTATSSGSESANTGSVVLTGLYQRIRQELERLQNVLCEPFLRSESAGAASTVTALQHQHAQAAATLSWAIQSLVVIITVRCQMMDLQASLFGVNAVVPSQVAHDMATATALPTLSEASTAVTVYMESIEVASKRLSSSEVKRGNDALDSIGEQKPSNEPLSPVAPLFANMVQELQAWKYCFETVASLEQCRFLETIINLRQWQRHLPSGTSRFGRWMHISFQETVSLLPIYFDRVHAFATPFYGFDTSAIWQQSPPQGSSRNLSSSNSTASASLAYRTDWDAVVTELLRRQEKLGGPPMAVALVLNALETANLHVERGFRFATPDADAEEDVRVLWPAVYLRSTIHLSSSLHSARSSPHSSGVLRVSQSSMLSNWSSSNTAGAGGSPFAIGGRKRPNSVSSPVSSQRNGGIGVEHHYSVLEYAPDTGMATSWPHSDWDSLATSTFANDKERPLAAPPERVPRYEEEDTSDSTDNETAFLFTAPLPIPSNPSLANGMKTFGLQSTFHSLKMGPWLQLVVFVKDKDDTRWHRRRAGLDDNEIQAFLLDVSTKLSATTIFSPSKRTAVLDLVLNEKRLHLPSGDTWTNEATVQTFLTNAKQVFGLRPVSPYAKDTPRSFSFYTPRSPRIPNARMDRLRRLKQATTPLHESAASFFLGPELASSIK